MAMREIIRIDEEKCDGCGDCIVNCPEGALQIVDGKARLVKESYCDGLGVCIGKCPLGAITIESREAEEFDEEAVKEHMAASAKAETKPIEEGCPHAAARAIHRAPAACPGTNVSERTPGTADESGPDAPSLLSHWPVQLGLVPPTAAFLKDADLLLVADCVPFAFADFHRRFLAGGNPIVVGCPKLDDTKPYVDKIRAMLDAGTLRSITVVRMEVPCCGGLSHVVRTALAASGAELPAKEVIVSIDGRIIDETQW